MIAKLKSALIWDKMDIFYVLAVGDAAAARRNLKGNSAYNLTAVNSPTFTPFRGYAGNGSSSYLNSNWVPSTNAVQFTQNDACMGVYVNAGTDTAANFLSPWASLNSTGTAAGTIINPRKASDGFGSRINDTTETNFGTSTTRYGLSALQRTTSSAQQGFRNGVSVGTASITSTGLTTCAPWVGTANFDEAGSGYVDNRVAACWAGASLTTAQHVLMNTILLEYLNAVGAA